MDVAMPQWTLLLKHLHKHRFGALLGVLTSPAQSDHNLPLNLRKPPMQMFVTERRMCSHHPDRGGRFQIRREQREKKENHD
jgi:hypothetical protein